MSDEPIISIEEFRKITGLASEDMDDSAILDAIDRLEALANIYINQTKNTLNEAWVPSSTTPYCLGGVIGHNKR